MLYLIDGLDTQYRIGVPERIKNTDTVDIENIDVYLRPLNKNSVLNLSPQFYGLL
jgi:hypothetical protein